MLSGHIDPDAQREVEALGAVDYLLKPLEFTTLLEAIRNADRTRSLRPDPLDD